MIGATLGEPPQSAVLPGCIPTLPQAMSGLAISARPGPDPDSWYISGSGFAPGVTIQLQELTCTAVPCPGEGLSVAGPIEATVDGRFSAFTSLPPGRTDGKRRIVAFEQGWLRTQLAVAPGVDVAATQPGTTVGYSAAVRTGEAAVDRVLQALASGDPEQLAALFQFRKLPALSDGQIVDALPTVTCGHGDGLLLAPPDGAPVSSALPAVLTDFFGNQIYAVFRIAPGPNQWRAFEGATYAIVLAGHQAGYQPRGAVLAVSQSGVVGLGQPCGARATFYLRDVASFVLAPLTTPAPPATGTGLARSTDDRLLMWLVGGAAAVGIAFASGSLAIARRRHYVP